LAGTLATKPITVGLEADPGVPTRLAHELAAALPPLLSHKVSGNVDWRVQVRSDELILDDQGRIPIERRARERMPAEGWDIMVCLTDLPRRNGTQPILADIRVTDGMAVASVPAIGWIRLRPHARDTVVHIIGLIAREKLGTGPTTRAHHHVRRRPTERISPVRQVPSTGSTVHLALSGLRGRARLLCGMVRDNRPWRLVPSLSKAIAAAVATAMFEIFYPTIWLMADALPPLRLGLICLVAILAMVVWLIADNQLWEHNRSAREEAILYNLATVITLFLGVACMYLVLFTVIWLAANVVISAQYLSLVLQHPSTAANYLNLVWLASSVGIVAGAVGSSLESRQAVLRATYSRREQERRRVRRHEARQGEEATAGPRSEPSS
jgi:hypothetical protein